VENRKILEYFHIVYNPSFWDNDWSCEDKTMGKKIRVVHHSQVEFYLKTVLDHSECIGKYC